MYLCVGVGVGAKWTIKLIAVQLCKEVEKEKMKKTQKIIENYEEKVGEIDM